MTDSITLEIFSDDIWPWCFTVVTQEFRATKKGLGANGPKSFTRNKYRRWDLNPHDLAITGF